MHATKRLRYLTHECTYLLIFLAQVRLCLNLCLQLLAPFSYLWTWQLGGRGYQLGVWTNVVCVRECGKMCACVCRTPLPSAVVSVPSSPARGAESGGVFRPPAEEGHTCTCNYAMYMLPWYLTHECTYLLIFLAQVRLCLNLCLQLLAPFSYLWTWQLGGRGYQLGVWTNVVCVRECGKMCACVCRTPLPSAVVSVPSSPARGAESGGVFRPPAEEGHTCTCNYAMHMLPWLHTICAVL